MKIQFEHTADGDMQRGHSVAATMSFTAELQSCRDSLAQLPVVGPTNRLRGPITLLAHRARQQRIPPERLIAELKGVLFRLPQFETRRAAERGEMMHQLVTEAINAYYAAAED